MYTARKRAIERNFTMRIRTRLRGAPMLAGIFVVSALGDSVINSARDIGTAGMYEYSFDGEALQFAAKTNGTFVDAQTQSTWNAFGEAIDGELADHQRNWVHAFPHFWFAWAAFHPEIEVYGLD